MSGKNSGLLYIVIYKGGYLRKYIYNVCYMYLYFYFSRYEVFNIYKLVYIIGLLKTWKGVGECRKKGKEDELPEKPVEMIRNDEVIRGTNRTSRKKHLGKMIKMERPNKMTICRNRKHWGKKIAFVLNKNNKLGLPTTPLFFLIQVKQLIIKQLDDI